MGKHMMLSRRNILQTGLSMGGVASLAAAGLAQTTWPAEQLNQELNICKPKGNPLQALQSGNRRFAKAWQEISSIADPAARIHQLQQHLGTHCLVDPRALAEGQRPWAAILTCADSRIPLEWIFAVGDGELFGVRSAGNTAFSEGIASLEYAVEKLGVSLILVMGHSSCGAVKASRAQEPLSPLLQSLIEQIQANTKGTNSLEDAVKANAVTVAQQLPARSTQLQTAAESGKIEIRASVFNIRSGVVQIL